ERVGEAVHEGALEGPHPLGPVLGDALAVPAGHVEPRALRVRGPDLEARRVDDAVELVLATAGDDAPLGDPLHALAVGVDEVRGGLVERLQVLVVEARPLAELAVPGLELL